MKTGDVLLYLSRSNKVGTRAALAAETRTYVQDLARPLPEWLIGTPLCVHAAPEALEVYVGQSCVNFLAARRQPAPEPESDKAEAKIDQSMIEAEMELRGLG